MAGLPEVRGEGVRAGVGVRVEGGVRGGEERVREAREGRRGVRRLSGERSERVGGVASAGVVSSMRYMYRPFMEYFRVIDIARQLSLGRMSPASPKSKFAVGHLLSIRYRRDNSRRTGGVSPSPARVVVQRFTPHRTWIAFKRNVHLNWADLIMKRQHAIGES